MRAQLWRWDKGGGEYDMKGGRSKVRWEEEEERGGEGGGVMGKEGCGMGRGRGRGGEGERLGEGGGRREGKEYEKGWGRG